MLPRFAMQFLVYFNDLIKNTDKMVVAIIAMKSEIGATNKMASIVGKNTGNIKINGAKHTTSRTSEETTALTGLPAAWKKIEFILIRQLIQVKERKIRKVFSPNSQ